MGSAFAYRLLQVGHTVSGWNRTPGRTGSLKQHGLRELASPDLTDDSIEAVLVCLADDRSLLDVAASGSACRPSWARALVACAATVSPGTLTRLRDLYGERFVAAPVIGAPEVVRSGAATFIIGGGAAARSGLAPLWAVFGGPRDVGDDPRHAAAVKLLINNLLLGEAAVVAETVRLGRHAGLDDQEIRAVLEDTPALPEALRNRLDSLFDAAHPGWFGSLLAVKDLDLALGLAGEGASLPVTRAARESYLVASHEGWADADNHVGRRTLRWNK